MCLTFKCIFGDKKTTVGISTVAMIEVKNNDKKVNKQNTYTFSPRVGRVGALDRKQSMVIPLS